jgi:molybdate transport system substrate-binding protein
MLAHFLTKLIALFALTCSPSLLAQPFLVAAAADLAPLESQLTQGFAATGGGNLRFTFGSSGMLARQIENGAPYDVFLSADEKLVQDLAAHGKLIRGSVASYATGRLGLWSARETPASPGALLDSRIRLVAIANPEHAPYGAAARALLERAGLWTRLQPKMVLAENVRQAYEYASSGNADAVITSWTLLWNKPGAKLLPAGGHPPIRQSGGIVAGTQREPQARAFLRFLLSPAGQSILCAGGLFSPAVSAR